ncbi:MAG: DUF3120 domain-containing protein [Cyanobacteria bacterium P01_G01_bin.49]
MISSPSTLSTNSLASPEQESLSQVHIPHQNSESWLIFWAAGFLVSVPVFIQAPLVRLFPEISLLMTGGWFGLAFYLMRQPKTHLWGDLLFGFSWSWLAGSIYWGWLRWEPLIHLPVESIGVPVAVWCLWRGWGKIGNFFYLGSLLGTGITDIYFYITDLIPHWRQLMQVDPTLATSIFQAALGQVQTPWGISWAIVLVNILLGVGLWAMQQSERHWWALAGAVLSTILVDSLFWLAACFA